jgi:TIR domain/Pentapeptide repeats (8 copies)
MANEEHVALLRAGVQKWNAWRKAHPQITPILRQVNLDYSDLRDCDLTSASLVAASLSGSNLRGALIGKADLSKSDLCGADLTAADLTSANLTGADFRHADLTSANLTHAILRGAELSGATIADADFRDCTMGFNLLGRLDLSLAKNLETVKHEGPSEIGVQTLYRSKGCISQSFLRGVGVPENFFLYINSLVSETIEFCSCFISYSSQDREFVERIHADLQDRGVRCWFAPKDLRIGDRLRPAFDEAIHRHDKLLVVLSQSSVESHWVEKEAETAFEKERQQNRVVLFPVRIDNAVMETKQAWAADIRRTRNIGDFCEWKSHDSYKKALDRLLRDLQLEQGMLALRAHEGAELT